MTGYRESDFVMICTNTTPNFTVPFTMLDCSEFSDRNRPNWDQMEKLVLEVAPTRVSTRTAGFSAVTTVQPIRRVVDEPDEDEGEAARIR